MSDDDREPSRFSASRADFPAIDYAPEHRSFPRRRERRSFFGRVGTVSAIIAISGIAVTASLLMLKTWPTITSEIHEGATAQAPATPATAPAPAAPDSPVTVPDNNLIGKQAQEWGIDTCLRRVVNLSAFLTRGTESRWMLTRGDKDSNAEMFSATIAARDGLTGLRGVSSLYAAPVANGGCGAAYQNTIYFPETCQAAREKFFPRFTSRIELGGDVAEAYSIPNGSGRLLLLPAGETGCVAIKSEIFY